MIKLMIVGRRAPGKSRRAGQRHLRNVHGPMVVLQPADAGPMPSGYVQNHVFDGIYPAHADGNRYVIERDLVTELWFENVDQMRASVQTPYYLANLKPDEPRFVDDPVVERILVKEREVRSGPRGPFKLFVFAVRVEADDEGWVRACDAAIAALGPADAVLVNEGLLGPSGAPFADIAIEGWYADREAAAEALDGGVFGAFGTAADPSRTFAVAAEEFSTERLRELNARQA